MQRVATTRASGQISSPTTELVISSVVAPQDCKNMPTFSPITARVTVAEVKYWSSLRSWSKRQWLVAGLGGFVSFLAIGLPTDVIDNPVFGRAIDETPWAMPVLIATSLIAGLLIGTYVDAQPNDRSAKSGTVGGLLTFFAVGCPVCNKVVLLALGTTGAVNYFEPVQPYLAAVGILALAYAFHRRITTSAHCLIPSN